MADSVGELFPTLRLFSGDSGTCSFDKYLDLLNQARKLLWAKTQYPGTMEWACICCVDGCWTMPSRYEQIHLAWLGKSPVSLGNEWYQSIPQIGIIDRIDGNNSCHRKIVEVGGSHVTFQDYTVGPYLVGLQAEGLADEGIGITVFTIDRYGVRQKETIQLLSPPQYAMGSTMTKAVIAIIKPRTAGRVRLYAIDPNNSDQRKLLAVYQPQDVNPTFSRYKIIGNNCSEQLTIYAKKKFYRLEDENDLVEFSEQALIHAITAVVYRENRSRNEYISELSLAIAEINREMSDHEQTIGSPLRMFFPDQVESLITSSGGWR